MDKRFWICGIVVAAAALILGMLVHGVLLRADYQAMAALYRSQEQANAHAAWVLPAYLLLGLAMTWLYRRMPASDGIDLARGARFGLAIALVSFVPWHILAFVAQPLPLSLMLRQVALDLAAMVLLGLLLAWLQPHRRVLMPLP
ncbi:MULTISPECIES: hypothetical protein [unclassified Luteimonas]|uniref:hypothetical protein n=1 Tax=unclassified Luteimonas TaxID=2629088 RepID=UPI0018F0A148|nr:MULTISPECIES: hypothetical protein [unclassified Luteimonas]MBJ6978733.1 hypothetical protein [Luteimonas sp. MC1895]MBJ6983633.1 hypothetical protein [Luteimonas sp. MC1750]QQO06476.1 hypothetical protein JGR68_03245 [Luteimonas sp. MC1750]